MEYNGRSEIAKMKYFHRLRTLPDERLVKRIFKMRMKQAREQMTKKKRNKSWCHEMKRII